MFVIGHYVGHSTIHGLGVFTKYPIISGSLVWKFEPTFDIEISTLMLQHLNEEDIMFVKTYSEYIPELDIFRLGNDGDIFMNHCECPTLTDCGETMTAARDLAAGAELTCDYGKINVLHFHCDKVLEDHKAKKCLV